MKKHGRLIDFITDLRKQGRYTFEKQEAGEVLNLNYNALKASLSRLSQKGKISYLKKGLYQIIPEEYVASGSLPPQWLIHDLMNYLGIPYYMGLLSAASFHGSAHQSSRVFQVICSRQIRPLKIGRTFIHFYVNKTLDITPTQDFETPTGCVKVSTPEGTAFDFIRYLHQSGHLNHIVTVLSDLMPVMNKNRLADLATKVSIRHVQQLGFLLEHMGAKDIAESLQSIVQEKAKRYVPLRTDITVKNAEKNEKWRVLVNEEVEPDL